MIDFGDKVREILACVDDEVDILTGDIDKLGRQFWPDSASGDFLKSWESALGIIAPTGASDIQRQTVVIVRLRVVGDLSTTYYYDMAARLGYVKTTDIIIVDGKTLPFRVGISRLDIDPLYDEINDTALSVVVRYKHKNSNVDTSLEQLFRLCKPTGTVIRFEAI